MTSRPTGAGWLFAAILVAHAVLLTWLTAARGAFGVPRNDGWAYSQVAFRQLATGRFTPDPWMQTMAVGQTTVVQPLLRVAGTDERALQVFVLLLGTSGLWASWSTLRRVLSPAWSAVVVGAVALGPIYGSAALSFMTDIPAFAVSAWALWAAAQALSGTRRRLGWLAVAYLASFAAFTLREFAVAQALAIGVASVLVARGRRERVESVLLGATWVVGAFVLREWRTGLPGARSPGLVGTPLRDLAIHGLESVATLGLLLAPVVLIGLVLLPGMRSRLGVVAVAVAAAAVLRGRIGLLPNAVTSVGSYPNAYAGAPDPVLPHLVWVVIESGALVLGVCLLLLLVRETRAAWPVRGERRTALGAEQGVRILLVVSAASAVLVPFAVCTLTGAAMFDRYLLPAIVPLAAVVLGREATRGRPARRAGIVGGVTLVAASAVGLVMVDSAAVNDGLFWRTGEQVSAATGVPPSRIAAGYAWWGAHQDGPPVREAALPVPAEWGFWVGLYDAPPPCLTVVAGDGGPSPVIDRRSARTVLGDVVRVAVVATGRC